MSFSATEYCLADATALAQAIRAGALTPQAAVDHAFDAIERCNPQLNAVILTMREQAQEQLRQLPADAPLRGVPVLLKDDCPSYAGAAMSYGSRAALGNVSTTDHTLVRRYQQAGMVIVGKTNLPEFSANVATAPSLHGRTLNPWSAAHNVGGSSGGSAAAVAARMVPLAYGNDGAGSIRIPAACTGLFGLRPSRGRVACGPVSSENWGGLVSHHVLTRSVRDSALMLDLSDALEPGSLYAAPAKAEDFSQALRRPPGRLRIGVLKDAGPDQALDSSILQGLQDTSRLLQELGHVTEEAQWNFSHIDLAAAFSRIIAAYTALEVDDLVRSTGKPATAEFFEPVNLGLAEQGRRLGAVELLAARNTCNSIARRLGEMFGRYDLLLCPVMPTLPQDLQALDVRQPDAQHFMQEFMDATVFTRPANAAGVPAMSVPLWQSASGLPIGMQFIAPYGAESRLLQLAAQLEQALPWDQRLPPVHA
ncbi:amidase [Comamonas piscis]|uniref:Amidase n=1 Tax=Comamonas piscis TaxID=1562974 RepID=A0A7G5ECR2_9BURK|nr:amidase [Comamonas piscis]QMV71787.1 amidase [Comamonas piscis]WSO34511.1 amidase [Comamonas piscis]